MSILLRPAMHSTQPRCLPQAPVDLAAAPRGETNSWDWREVSRATKPRGAVPVQLLGLTGVGPIPV
jgi:hypothetical protein